MDGGGTRGLSRTGDKGWGQAGSIHQIAASLNPRRGTEPKTGTLDRRRGMAWGWSCRKFS